MGRQCPEKSETPHKLALIDRFPTFNSSPAGDTSGTAYVVMSQFGIDFQVCGIGEVSMTSELEAHNLAVGIFIHRLRIP